MAFGARPLGTEAAFPGSAQEASAVTIWTLADEIDLDLSLLRLTRSEEANLMHCVATEGIDGVDFLGYCVCLLV